MRGRWTLLLSVLFVAGAPVPCATADTHAVIVNQSGERMILNYNRELRTGTAVWTSLKATVSGPGDARMEIIDTKSKCRAGGWAIEFRMYDGGKLYNKSQYCIRLGFAEVGCLGVHFAEGRVNWYKVPGNYCSAAWWDQQGAKAFEEGSKPFEEVVRVLEQAAKLKGK